MLEIKKNISEMNNSPEYLNSRFDVRRRISNLEKRLVEVI